MRKKTAVAIGSILSSIAILTAILFTHSNNIKPTAASNEHTASCHWNHYSRVEPTYLDKGIQEYYVCCEHHESVLDRPSIGNITDMGTPSREFINSLDDDDFRVIPSYQTQLEPVQSLIDKIPTNYCATDGSLIDLAYREYYALSEANRSYIQNANKLLTVYNSYHQDFEILIDSTLNEYQYQIYNTTYDVEYDYDEMYGYYSNFTDIYFTTDCWFGLGRNNQKVVIDYHEVFFYAYNQSSVVKDIQIRDKYDFRLKAQHFTCYPRVWTKINIPLSVFVTGKLDDLFIGVYYEGKTHQTENEGFRYTSLYGMTGRINKYDYINSDDDNQINNNVDFTGLDVLANEVDYCAHINPNAYSASQGKVNFITRQPYSNITGVEFDAKIDGVATGWWGIGHASSVASAQIYTGMKTTGVTTTNNEFQHFSLSLSVTGPEYIYFIVEVNTFVKDLFIDNVTIKCGANTYTDDFNGGTTTLFNNETAVLAGAVEFETLEEPVYYVSRNVADYCLQIDTSNYGGSAVSYKTTFISKQTYTGVTTISFDAKIDGTMTPLDGTEQIWWGFGVSGDDSVYVTNFTRQTLTTNDEWKHMTFTNSGADGYVKFVINPNKTTCNIYIDNIVIEHSGGTSVEGFESTGAALFNIGNFASIYKKNGASINFGGYTGSDSYNVKLDGWMYGNRASNVATMVTKQAYTNVTNISFDFKIDGTISESNPSDYWIGVSHNDTTPFSIYKNVSIRRMTTTNDDWVHLDFTFTGLGSQYFAIANNPGHGHNDLYIDNVVIVANGLTYNDGFDGGVSELFDIGQDAYLNNTPFEDSTFDIYNSIMNSNASFEGPDFNRNLLGDNEPLLFGNITHEIIEGGQYVILIKNDDVNVDYLLINGNSISLFHNQTLINSINPTSNTYSLVIANNGKTSVNGTYMGQTDGVNDNIRFVSLFNRGTVIFRSIKLYTSVYTNNSRETIDGIEVPNFEGEDNVVFAAYATPTVENWSGGDVNPTLINDEQYQAFVDAGFIKIIPLYEGRTGYRYQFNTLYDQYLEASDETTKESLKQQLIHTVELISEKADRDAMIALDVAERYGIQYVVLNAIIFELIGQTTPNGNNIHEEDYVWIFDTVFSDDYEYFRQVSYVGNFLQDEPVGVEGLTRLLAAVTLYYEYCERMGIMSEPIINLLPGGNTTSYKQYLDYYFEHIAPLVGYVSFDQYVLDYNTSTNKYSVLSTHLLNLEMLATRILNSGRRIQLRTFIYPLPNQDGSHRAITLADELRFQVYANLVYGASEIIYYGYSFTSSTQETTALVNLYTGEKGPNYYLAQEVNNEVLTFGAAYRRFQWQGTIAKRRTGYTCTQISSLQSALSSHAGISSYSVNQHTLIGCFADVNNQYAYVVMQYNDPKTSSNVDTVNLTFNNYNAIIVYQNGEKHAYRLTNHKYTLSLNPGCGAFIIPITLD